MSIATPMEEFTKQAMQKSREGTLKAPTGQTLHCKGWEQEAALRMLCNNLDPQVAEKPQELVVYGGTGKAARNHAAFDVIVRELLMLGNDETLLIQSGKAVGVLKTHEDAPRVLLANANLVPAWADWPHFWELEALGLTMYGQMTAGSWIYIGTQGILQGTFETFAAAAQKHFGGTLAGRLVVSAGLGGMGGAQPLSVTLNGGVFLGVDVDAARIARRVEQGYLDEHAADLPSALAKVEAAKAAKRPLSVGVTANIVSVLLDLVRLGVVPDLLTDQTSAHDPLGGYVPPGLDLSQAEALRKSDPEGYVDASRRGMVAQLVASLELRRRGSQLFDYGNNLRGQALLHKSAAEHGLTHATLFEAMPGFVPAYIRPLFCEGKGPFRWVALSGDPKDIERTDEAVLDVMKGTKSEAHLRRWLTMAGQKVKFQGLPARICWLGYGERALVGQRFNELVKTGAVSAPIVIGRDHLDSGSVASPNRETEAMRDGSDAISDWVFLNALANCAAGATWVSVHHGGGVGIGFSQHAGMVVVADGTERAARRLKRVLTTDPAMGVLRHADAGYKEALDFAAAHGPRVPHQTWGHSTPGQTPDST